MYINLLPTKEKNLLRWRYNARATLVAVILFAMITVVSAPGLLSAIIYLRYGVILPARVSQNTSLDTATSTASTTIAFITSEIEAVNSKIAIMNVNINALPQNKESVVIKRLVEALGRATKKAGSKATFSSFHFTTNAGDEKTKISATYTVSLSGVAESRAMLLALTKELRQTEGVMSVDNPISNYVPGKNLSFTIVITAL